MIIITVSIIQQARKEQDSVFSPGPGPDIISGKDFANTDTEEFATDGILAMFEKIQDCHDTEPWHNENETLGMGLKISDFLSSIPSRIRTSP